MIDEDAIGYRWETVGRTLDERSRRLFAAAEVRSAGWGGLAVVSRITGLSVDMKKKELVCNFNNGGSDYRPKGEPRRVNVHDFEDKTLGKVVPYGVYDIAANAGFVSRRAESTPPA